MDKNTITIDQLILLFSNLQIKEVQLVLFTHKNEAQTSATEKPIITRGKNKRKLRVVKKPSPVISKRTKRVRFGKENIINESIANNDFRARYKAHCKNNIREYSTDNFIPLNSSNVKKILPGILKQSKKVCVNENSETPVNVNTNSGLNTRKIDRTRLDAVKRNLFLDFADEPSSSGSSAADDTLSFTCSSSSSDDWKKDRLEEQESSDSE